MKVAIIEDDESIIDAVKVAFEFRWPEVILTSAKSGEDGIAMVKEEAPDIIILDINLPDINGFQVLKDIRRFTNAPVIILTVRSDDTDVLRGLESGADDYIIKPFNYLNLLARIKAILRRTEKTGIKDEENVNFGGKLQIDFVNQKVRVSDKQVDLTPIEYKLLVLLAKNRGKVVSHNQIKEELWGKQPGSDSDNIRSIIQRLRKKLYDIPPKIILNKYGTGYILNI